MIRKGDITTENRELTQRGGQLADAAVLVSGSDEAGIREVFLNAGFYDRLSKPIEPSALEELLNRIFP